MSTGNELDNEKEIYGENQVNEDTGNNSEEKPVTFAETTTTVSEDVQMKNVSDVSDEKDVLKDVNEEEGGGIIDANMEKNNTINMVTEKVGVKEENQQNKNQVDSTPSSSTRIKSEKMDRNTELNPIKEESTNVTSPLKPIDGAVLSETVGGAPVRKWLNKEVTPFLLQGMRELVKQRPEDPLRFLGEYLTEQSKIHQTD